MTLLARPVARAHGFAADTPCDRRDDALLALVDEGLSASEISLLLVDDVRLFEASLTVRIVTAKRERFVRVTEPERFRAVRAYVDRDVQSRWSPLFPGRSQMCGMSARHLRRLLAQIEDPDSRRERA